MVKPALCFGLFSSKQSFVFAVSNNALALSDGSAERAYNTLHVCKMGVSPLDILLFQRMCSSL